MRASVMAVSLCISSASLWADTAQQRLQESATVFKEVMTVPEKGIPQDLLDRAQCAVVVPGLKKGAFIVGAQYGRGFVTCRNPGGTGWGAPAAIRIEGGSVGFQIGGSDSDIVMLVMNKRGMDRLMGSKFTLGADATVAAGPVGRHVAAKTDAYMTAEILTWARSKGIFAGISLDGATLRPDRDENAELYGRKLETRDIVMGKMAAPASARPLLAELDRYSPRETGASATTSQPGETGSSRATRRKRNH